MEQTECSETSAYKIQTPGNYPEENIQHTEHGESLKSRKCGMLDNGKTSNSEYNTVVTRRKKKKMIGPSSVGLFLLDSIFYPRNERATFEMNWCYFGVPFCLWIF
jgi:hypothetical protein